MHLDLVMSVPNCSCDFYPQTAEIFGHEVCNAPIIGAWVLAVLIALVCSYRLERLPQDVVGGMSYTVSYFTYGMMITSGLVVHTLYTVECGKQDPTHTWLSFARLDGSLTSCIAASFFFNALVDIRVIVENRICTTAIMLLTYFLIFYAYFDDYYFRLMYFSSIYFGCGGYVAIQTYLIVERKQWRASIWLMMASIVGATCMLLVQSYSCLLCESLGAWSVQGIWYYGSDLSMGLLFMYIWKTRLTPSSTEVKSEDDKNEKSQKYTSQDTIAFPLKSIAGDQHKSCIKTDIPSFVSSASKV